MKRITCLILFFEKKNLQRMKRDISITSVFWLVNSGIFLTNTHFMRSFLFNDFFSGSNKEQKKNDICLFDKLKSKHFFRQLVILNQIKSRIEYCHFDLNK